MTELADPRYVGTAPTIQTCVGFLITTLSIRMIPSLAGRVGWNHAFAFLAPGLILLLAAMLRLRALPEASPLAQGRQQRVGLLRPRRPDRMPAPAIETFSREVNPCPRPAPTASPKTCSASTARSRAA